jgi:hypothetical protein
MPKSLFAAVVWRLKCVLATAAALEFEGDLVAHTAEQKAELLRRAAQYESEGQATLAADLRKRAEGLNLETPAATILPAVAHLTAENTTLPQLAEATDATTTTENEQSTASNGRRRKAT